MASGGRPLDTVIAMLMLSPPAKRMLHDAYKQEEKSKQYLLATVGTGDILCSVEGFHSFDRLVR
jgi:hypothetical protein